MDCTVAAWVNVSGSALQVIGVGFLAWDLIAAGRLPDVRAMGRRLLRRSPPVISATSKADQTLTVEGDPAVVPPEAKGGDVASQLRALERRIKEVGTAIEREATLRAEAVARLERSTQEGLQSLQNEVTALRRDLMSDRARAKSRPWIAWAGVAAFLFGLASNVAGSAMAIPCTQS